MTGKTTEVRAFRIKIISLDDAKKQIGEDSKVFTKIDFSDTIGGCGLLIFSKNSALKLAKILLEGMEYCDEKVEDGFSEVEVSALNEICNIVISAYVDTIANFMDSSLTMTPPSFIVGKGCEILENVVNKYLKDDEKSNLMFIFESTLSSSAIDSDFEVLVILPLKSIGLLLSKVIKSEKCDE